MFIFGSIESVLILASKLNFYKGSITEYKGAKIIIPFKKHFTEKSLCVGNHFITRRKIFLSHEIFSSTDCTLYHIIWSFFERNFCSDVILRNKF